MLRAVRTFIVGRLIWGLWAAKLARRRLACASGTVRSAMARPFDGLPTGIEQLDSSKPRRRMRRVVLWLRNPVRMAAGYLLRGEGARRSWLEGIIAGLPRAANISYVLHYWDARGRRHSILTDDPLRGLGPPVPRQAGARLSQVMAAYHGGRDVTPVIKQVSSSFHHQEEGVGASAVDAYLRHRKGLSLETDCLVVTDASLTERRIALSGPPQACA